LAAGVEDRDAPGPGGAQERADLAGALTGAGAGERVGRVHEGGVHVHDQERRPAAESAAAAPAAPLVQLALLARDDVVPDGHGLSSYRVTSTVRNEPKPRLSGITSRPFTFGLSR